MQSNWEIWKNTEMMNLALSSEGIGEKDKGGQAALTMQMMDDEHATLSLLALLTDLVVLHVGNDADVYAKELPKYVSFGFVNGNFNLLCRP